MLFIKLTIFLEYLLVQNVIGSSLFCFVETADRIDFSTIKTDPNTTSTNSIKIMWKEPEISNGPIVSYQLEYKKVGENVRSKNIK